MTSKLHAAATDAVVTAKPARRKFLKAATGAAAAGATIGFPMISVAQSPIVLKMQGAWGAKDIFNEMAEQYVARVNEMAGGRLRIDYLVAGSVVKPFEVMDATSQGRDRRRPHGGGVLVRQEQGRLAVRLRPDQRLRRQPDAGLDPAQGHALLRRAGRRSSASTSWRSSRCRCRPSRSAGSRSRSRARPS